MEENVWPVARSGSAWRQIIIVLATLPLFMNGGPARAEDDPATLGWSETYAGVFIGAGLRQTTSWLMLMASRIGAMRVQCPITMTPAWQAGR